MTIRIERWLPEPSGELERKIRTLAETGGVVHIAVMPDAHVAEDVCVGTVTATRDRLLPAAVGSDIGCGIVARRFDVEADTIDRDRAARILSALYDRVPCSYHESSKAVLPPELQDAPLSTLHLASMARREGRLGLGTLGRGNHFLELQRDEDGYLWLMLHSGSRAMGPAIRKHHESRGARDRTGLVFLEAETPEGRAYLLDVGWAVTYARLNRSWMEARVVEILFDELGAEAEDRIECDHDHVQLERHGEDLLVHRKGAARVGPGELGVVPGSMGTSSFHVEGRGSGASLCSCSHGAGRAMSRSEARRRISKRQLDHEMQGVWFDHRIGNRLREEAPSAYKDISSVMRAQRELVRVVRKLEPILVYKGD